ncbi:MAG TPA: POTRA domain-containing protein [Blastocatellia bacterium]|nr:POTRA domain-containing protein [Blastocatellia bacterium]
MPFASLRASDLSDFIGRRVTRVDVALEGAAGGGTRELREIILVAAGQEYSPVRIHDSLVRLYQSGLVAGARVEGVAVGADGVALQFIVRPQARIDTVDFEGRAIFPEGELRARLNELDTGERLSPGAVARGQAELLSYYSSRGYYQAKIASDVRLDPTGTRATVVYTVDPGEPALLSSYTLDVEGQRIDLSGIDHALVEGEPFTQAKVQEEMERIKQTYLKAGYLAVSVDNNTAADLINNTVAVTIEVKSGPLVSIGVQGLELSEEKQREILPFYTQGNLDEFSLEEGRRRLLDYAQRQGYFFAQVAKPDLPDLSRAGTIQLDYVVDTGRRYRLSNIDIEGVDAIPERELVEEMRSREGNFIPFFGLGRGITSNDYLRQDANLIQKRLRELGYRRSVVEVLRGVSVDGEDLIITFNVEQGPRTYVEQIGVRGNSIFTSEQLNERLTIEPDDPLVASRVRESADRVLAAYNQLGYADAEVISELTELGNVNGRDWVRLGYTIREGNRARIANVTTRGNALTKTGRLERDFYLFKAGEWLQNEKLQETERVLYETDAFSSVRISSDTITTTPDGTEERNVTVDLAEARRWLLIYGFGFQTSKSDLEVPGLGFLNGVRGVVQLTNSNLLGRLYTGSAQLRVSRDELFGQLSFQNPRPLGLEWPALVSVFARRLAEQAFRSDRYTATFQVERRLTPESILYLAYNFERISIFDLQGSIEDIERNMRAIRLGRIGPSYLRDTTDRATEPTRGTLTFGSLTYASTFLGGNEKFIKMQVEHKRFYPIKRFYDTVYSVSGRLGLATPFGGNETLPISERFFAGGATDLRGFDFERAGPQELADVNGEMRLVPVGGNAVFVLNNELRFPLIGILGGAVFADTGNVFRRVRDFRPQDLTQSVGFGLRVKTPVGPVRLDFAYLALNRPPGVPSYQIHFSLGQTF